MNIFFALGIELLLVLGLIASQFLGVHPAHTGKGIAKQMVQFAVDFAREHQQKVIRLDVLKGNLRAEKLYTGMGFQYLHTLPMFYEDTGWTEFQLYEYRL